MIYGQLSADQTSLVKYPVYEFDLITALRTKYPNSSLPAVITSAFALSEGYAVVQQTAAPALLAYQTAVEGAPVLTNGVWTQVWTVVDNTLAAAQAAHSQVINQACQNAILAGFNSSALGAAYTYPSKATDQQNLSASVLASLMPGLPSTWTTPFWCMNSTGVWAFVNHTAAQIQQVGTDGKTAILAAMSKNQNLQTQIANCTTVSAVRDIVW